MINTAFIVDVARSGKKDHRGQRQQDSGLQGSTRFRLGRVQKTAKGQ